MSYLGLLTTSSVCGRMRMSNPSVPRKDSLSTDQMIEIAKRTREKMVEAADDLAIITAELRKRLAEWKDNEDEA